MLHRQAEARLIDLLKRFPAVALLGPRQVGKTTLARAVADQLGDDAVYLDLELPADRTRLLDAEVYFADHENQLVVMDEIHRAPEIFQTLRSVIDKRRRRGSGTVSSSFWDRLPSNCCSKVQRLWPAESHRWS